MRGGEVRALVELDMGIPTSADFEAQSAGGTVRAGGPKGLHIGTVTAIRAKEPGSSVLVFELDLPECEVYL